MICCVMSLENFILAFYFIKSFTTSDAIIKPATDGTNDMLPGIRFFPFCSSFCETFMKKASILLTKLRIEYI